MKRVCLISPAHLSSNPRLVKEADALHAAGWDVRVVHGDHYPPARGFDEALRASRPWRSIAIGYASDWSNLPGRLRQKCYRRWLRVARRPSWQVAARALHVAHDDLVAAAVRSGAMLFIGHTVAGLAAAAAAAMRVGGRYAFDAEDFHPTETAEAIHDPGFARSIATIERALLPGAGYVTAAAPLIADAYADRYGIARPEVMLNVFPRRLAPPAPRHRPGPPAPVKAYWFSQTIGPGRGLEEAVITLGRMRTVCRLQLRGTAAPAMMARLRTLNAQSPTPVALEFADTAPADDMIRLAAEHDLGLAPELPTPPNRDICLTNKLFTYLLAGLPIAASPTRAQHRFATELRAAVRLVDFRQPERAAHELDEWLDDPAEFDRAAEAAWQAGQDRFNWETEQGVLLEAVARLDHDSSAAEGAA